MRVRALLATAFSALSVVAAVASCSTEPSYYVSCDAVITRCRTVCETWCDGWGCYPVCYDQCWDECRNYPDPPPPAEPEAPAPPRDAGAAAAKPGVLCSPCSSNDDCGGGALCIQRGGGDAGEEPAFCGSPCASNADCPAGFGCASLGASFQCLPASDRCE